MTHPPAPDPPPVGEKQALGAFTEEILRAPPPPAPEHGTEDPHGRRLAILAFTALGVVYGDIGTSPLYAIKDCFKAVYGIAPTRDNVFGLLSLIVWSLTLVVTVKYVGFILRADNRGEGGVYALLALIIKRARKEGVSRRRNALILLGVFGGAFLYGDGIITPAISVLGAVEGLEVLAGPAFADRFVVPLAVAIIAALFYFQYHGTARIGGAFGWIMAIYFVSIAVLGIRAVIGDPQILGAINPWYGVQFFLDHPQRSFVVLGAVVLVITGGEALYADMGHFGRKPIRLAWYGVVLPALVLNYFGQGALILRNPAAVENPFYLLAPSWFVLPLLFIATAAAVVASQALISGAFSLTQQAVQLGYCPRVHIVHTSEKEAGQIYVPEVNVALAIGTLLLVVAFGSSTALGQAYGVAVTGTMIITNLLFFAVARDRFGWSALQAWAFLIVFMIIDVTFFTSNLLKVESGGWVPLVIAACVFALMTTWKRGRDLLRSIMVERSLPLEDLLKSLELGSVARVPGTAIFMTSESEGTPVVLLHHLKHNKVLHQQVILLSIVTREVPEVPQQNRIKLESLSNGMHRVTAYYGFMQSPNVEQIREGVSALGIRTSRMDTTYYLGREQLIARSSVGMARWRKRLFGLMAKNARSATEFFSIPPNRVVELGAQIEF
jgi:KUP system potassium uptake protein